MLCPQNTGSLFHRNFIQPSSSLSELLLIIYQNYLSWPSASSIGSKASSSSCSTFFAFADFEDFADDVFEDILVSILEGILLENSGVFSKVYTPLQKSLPTCSRFAIENCRDFGQFAIIIPLAPQY
jgi:hypothetical protein